MFVVFSALLSVISIIVFISGTTTSIVLYLNKAHPLLEFLFIITSVMMCARAYFVILEAAVLTMKSWFLMMPFKSISLTFTLLSLL